MLFLRNKHKNEIGKAVQVLYMDGKAPVYGVLDKAGLVVRINPGAHLTFQEKIDLKIPQIEELRKRLNLNCPVYSMLWNIRDIIPLPNGGQDLFGYDIREAPNIPKLPNF